MPGNWVHYYFARDVAKDNDFVFNKEYYFGALGHDFLSYIPNLEKRDRLYRDFHEEKTREILCFVFDYLYDKGLIDYLHGYLAHYALDSGSSFFINSLQNEGYDRQSVKAALDQAILRRRNIRLHNKPELWPKIGLGRRLPENISNFYIAAAREVYGNKLDENLLNKAYQRFMRVLKVHSSSLGLLNLVSNWYDLPAESLLPMEVSEELYKEFMINYEESRGFFNKLLEDGSPCADRNFKGEFL